MGVEIALSRAYIDLAREWRELGNVGNALDCLVRAGETLKDIKTRGSVLDKPLKELDLNTRAYGALAYSRTSPEIKTIRELCDQTQADLLQRRHLGKTSLREIIRKLDELGLELKEGN